MMSPTEHISGDITGAPFAVNCFSITCGYQRRHKLIDFEKSFEIIIGPDFEGNKLTDTSGDRGGKTRAGLTQLNYSAFRAKQGLPYQWIENAEMDEIKKWYKIYAWDNAGCDQILACGKDKLAFVEFNCSVQRGYVKAVHTLQEALALPELNCTGYFGPITREAVNVAHEDSVVARYLQSMRDYFEEHVKQNPSQEKFLAGWLRRISSVEKIINEG
jgi:lysozyme family protein